jgi:hypothetical protein
MGSNNKGGLVGGFDILRLPNTPEVSGTAGADSIDVVFTDPSDVGGGSITSRTASATTGGTTTTATGTGTTVTITGLSAATFTVGGFITNDFGNSPDSDTVSVQILFDRAIFMGGYSASNYDTRIDYITIASTGTASNFGNCTACSALCGGIASSTRGVCGEDTSYQKDYQYITFASTGNAANFGDLINRNTEYPGNWGGNYLPAFFSGGGTRGITYGGYGEVSGSATYRNWIEYITIASTGNGTDFGDAVLAAYNRAGFASSTRGVCGGGEGSGGRTDSIDYITIASTGNGTDFGDLSGSRSYLGAANSSTRGIFAGGYIGSNVNIIEYVTIASTGNATDFGDLLGTRRQTAGTSSNVRAVFGGGTGSRGTWEDEIDYVTIASTGDASDFGDLRNGKYGAGSASANHGGLH